MPRVVAVDDAAIVYALHAFFDRQAPMRACSPAQGRSPIPVSPSSKSERMVRNASSRCS
jgi:hypothetical protein